MTPCAWRVQSPGETLICRLVMVQGLGRQERNVLPVLGRRRHFLEELTPGLSSDEVRLVEEEEATARAGTAVREFAHSSTPQPGQEDLGRAVPVPQSRTGEGQGMGQRANGQSTCPSWTDSSKPFPICLLLFYCLSWLPGSFLASGLLVTQSLSPLPDAGFVDPVLGLVLWTPTVLLPRFLLRSDFGLGTMMVPSGWPPYHRMVWCHLLGANRALCQRSHISKLAGFQLLSPSAGAFVWCSVCTATRGGSEA